MDSADWSPGFIREKPPGWENRAAEMKRLRAIDKKQASPSPSYGNTSEPVRRSPDITLKSGLKVTFTQPDNAKIGRAAKSLFPGKTEVEQIPTYEESRAKTTAKQPGEPLKRQPIAVPSADSPVRAMRPAAGVLVKQPKSLQQPILKPVGTHF